MMITEIDASLLEKIADLTRQARRARSTSARTAAARPRQSTEHIAIDPQTDGKRGIDHPHQGRYARASSATSPSSSARAA